MCVIVCVYPSAGIPVTFQLQCLFTFWVGEARHPGNRAKGGGREGGRVEEGRMGEMGRKEGRLALL